MSTEGIRVSISASENLVTSETDLEDMEAGTAYTDSQLAKRDEEIARRAFEAADRTIEILDPSGPYAVRAFDTADDYINSEEFKKATK